MKNGKKKILILEKDYFFRDVLREVCGPLGETLLVEDLNKALRLIMEKTYDLLLLDWSLIGSQSASLFSTIRSFQPKAKKLVLVLEPDLTNVVAAMKAGADDILWPSQDLKTLSEKIAEYMGQNNERPNTKAFISRMAESISEKALLQETSLANASREFSRTFLLYTLKMKKMKRSQLAHILSVSPRTLHRHLSI
jgi:DNA-binding NtrC family response regulator